MTSFSKQYSFPNVSVAETIRGPQQFSSVWRNTIGIAAPFTKGPLLATINSRQELVSLFGEDNSLGSISVRQAMLQGATNFVISRVLPIAKKASTTISFTAPEGAISTEPVTGSTDNRTVGMSIDFSYISDVLTENKDLVAFAINEQGSRYIKPVTNKGAELDTAFVGIGSLVLQKHTTLYSVTYDYFLRTTEPESTTSTKDLAVAGFDEIAGTDIPSTTSTATIKKITFPKSSITKDKYIEAFQPGMRITGGAGGPTFDTPGLVLSELYEEDVNTYAFYANIQTSAAGDGSIKLLLPTDEDQDVLETGPLSILDVYKVYWRSPLGYTLPGIINYMGADVTANYQPLSYLVLNRNSDAGITKNLTYYTQNPDSSTLAEQETGVTYTIGSVTDTYINVIEPIQTINIMKTSVSVGELDPVTNGYNSVDAFTKNKPVSDILEELKFELAKDTILNQLGVDVSTNISSLPYSLSLVLGKEGVFGNYLVYKVSRISSGVGDLDINFLDGATPLFDQPISFIDGTDELSPAGRFFYSRQGQKVLYIEAISPGEFGNNVYVNVKPVDKSNFILEVRDNTSELYGGVPTLPNESFYLSNTAVDLVSGIYPETLSSNFIRAYYVPVIDAVGSGTTGVDFNLMPARLIPSDNQNTALDLKYEVHPNHAGATYLQNIPLLGGTEPSLTDSSITEDAYINAIDRLKEEDIALIAAPGIIAGDIRFERAINALIQQADQSTPYNGLRIAVLATPPRLTKSRAEILNAQYSSKNLVLVGGWSTLITSRGVGLSQYSSEGYYLGLLATTDTYVSPSSSYDGKFIIGATNLDTDNKLDSLDAYTNNNIEMMYVDTVTNKIKFLNGRTTAGDINNRWVSIRRQTQHLIMNIVRNLEWARSAPNNDDIRQRAASAVDAILKVEQRRGAIASYQPTIVNISDPTRFANGFLDLIMIWTPVFPADYITVELIRSVTTNFTLEVSKN